MGNRDRDENWAFTFNLKRAQLFGWWKISTRSRSKKFSYGLYKSLALLWLNFYTLLQLLDLYEAITDLEMFSSNMCGTSVSLVSTFKTLAVLYHADKFQDLHRSLLNRLHVTEDDREEDGKILVRARLEIIQLTKIFFSLVVPTIFGWSIMPLIDETDEKRLPLRLWTPYDWRQSPAYELFYMYQVLGLWVFAVNILTQDLIFFGFIIQICTEYEILEKNLRRLLEEKCGEKEERKLIEAIKGNIVHHQKILKRIDQVQSIYRDSFLVHFSGAAPLLSVIGFNIISAGKTTGLTTHLISQIGYVGSTLFDIFFFCAFGERLRQKGLKISEAIYDGAWHRIGRAPRRLLIIFMARAQNSPGLKAGILNINLQWFLQILRNSYNIITVMNQTSRH